MKFCTKLDVSFLFLIFHVLSHTVIISMVKNHWRYILSNTYVYLFTSKMCSWISCVLRTLFLFEPFTVCVQHKICSTLVVELYLCNIKKNKLHLKFSVTSMPSYIKLLYLDSNTLKLNSCKGTNNYGIISNYNAKYFHRWMFIIIRGFTKYF